MKIEHKGKKYELDVEKAVRDGYLKEEYPEPKVGEFYRHINGSISIVAMNNIDEFCLIDISYGEGKLKEGVGNRFHDSVENINDIFGDFRHEFTKLEGIEIYEL